MIPISWFGSIARVVMSYRNHVIQKPRRIRTGRAGWPRDFPAVRRVSDIMYRGKEMDMNSVAVEPRNPRARYSNLRHGHAWRTGAARTGVRATNGIMAAEGRGIKSVGM